MVPYHVQFQQNLPQLWLRELLENIKEDLILHLLPNTTAAHETIETRD